MLGMWYTGWLAPRNAVRPEASSSASERANRLIRLFLFSYIMENDSVYQLVKQYETHRLLWDSKHPDYYNKSKREEIWRAISVAVNVPDNELKKKMTSLLGSYRREKSREKRSHIDGSGQDDVYKSKWFAFTWFKFLADRDIPNDTTDTMDNDSMQAGNIRSATPLHESDSPRQNSASADLCGSLNNAVDAHLNSDMLLNVYKILKKTSTTPPDHYESFGNYVTGELRKYPSQIVPHVKRAIVDVLFRADLGEFNLASKTMSTEPKFQRSSSPTSNQVLPAFMEETDPPYMEEASDNIPFRPKLRPLKFFPYSYS